MNHQRVVIVNADDLGFCPAVNAGIFEAFRSGIVRSASLMVDAGASEAAAAALQRLPQLDVGLHLDLGEWAFSHGEWRQVRVVVDTADERAVEREVARQLGRFRELVGHDPSHIDSHQHAHRSEPISTVVCHAANELRIPPRGFSERVRFCGHFYGQAADGAPLDVSPAALCRVLGSLGPGVTEVSCHPARGLPADPYYCAPRELELAALCDPGVAAFIDEHDLVLASFADLS